MIDRLRAAAEALNEGDVEPFVALIAEDSEWRGVTSGHLWWKQTPACHGPEEARQVLLSQFSKRRALGAVIQPEFTQVGDRIVGSTRWTTPDGRAQERFQVLTLRDGTIVDIQGCDSRGDAERFARSARP
jgi:ketosteroid isomerase-like protein